MSIFSVILHFFQDLFSGLKKAWDKLPANIQQGLLNGSGILNIINQFTGQDPKLTIATIQANYPNEDLTVIYAGLAAIAKAWNLNVPSTLEDLIVVIQNYLKTVEATVWPAIISSAASILAQILSGGGTPFEIISTLIQWVFTNLVKPKEIVMASLPASGASPTVTESGIPATTTTIPIPQPDVVSNFTTEQVDPNV